MEIQSLYYVISTIIMIFGVAICLHLYIIEREKLYFAWLIGLCMLLAKYFGCLMLKFIAPSFEISKVLPSYTSILFSLVIYIGLFIYQKEKDHPKKIGQVCGVLFCGLLLYWLLSSIPYVIVVVIFYVAFGYNLYLTHNHKSFILVFINNSYLLIGLGIINAKQSLSTTQTGAQFLSLIIIFLMFIILLHMLIFNFLKAKMNRQNLNTQLQMAMAAGHAGIIEGVYPEGAFKAALMFYTGHGYHEEMIYSLDAFWEKIHPEDHQPIISTIELVASQQSWHKTLEFRLKDMNHCYQWFRVDVRVEQDETSLTKYIGLINNIHTQKDKEWSMALSQLTLEHTSLVVYVLKADMHFYYVNQTMCQLYGYSWEELMKMTLKDLKPSITKETWDLWLREIGSKGVMEMETQHFTKAGKVLQLELCISEMPVQQDMYYCVFAKDITKLRSTLSKLEEQLSFNTTLIENAPIGICVKSVENDLRYSIWNKCMEDLTGLSAKDVVGRQAFELFDETVAQRYHELDLMVFKKQTVFEIREKHLLSGQDEQIIESYHIPIFNQLQKITHILILCKDVSNNHIKQQQVIQSERMQIVSQLAGGISHDFNNYLTGALGYATLLKSKLTDPTLLRFVENIIISSQRAANLTNQLCTFSRKNSAGFDVIDMHDLVSKSVEMFRHMYSKSIDIKMNLCSNLQINGDLIQIQNILFILFLNARDAMPGGGTLEIRTQQIDEVPHNITYDFTSIEDSSYFCLSVTDTGTGIEEDVLSHIFEPFFTTKAAYRGTGMGLAVLYGSIKAHHGAIKVRSQVDVGTTFKVYLPLIANSKTPQLWNAMACQTISNGNILLADDEGIVRIYITDILEHYGYRVRTCCNGSEAVKLFKNNPELYDLVILDIKMPEMGGKEAFYYIKHLRPQIRVIMITGHILEKDIVDLQLEGLDVILQKPIKAKALMTHVTRILKEKKVS